jgi:hypothetical protein
MKNKTSKQKKTKSKQKGSVVGGYSTYFVTKDTESLSRRRYLQDA